MYPERQESMACQLLILPARCERIFQESEQAKDGYRSLNELVSSAIETPSLLA